LCNLPYVPQIIADRRQVSDWYCEAFAGSVLFRPEIPKGTEFNYAYYPVLFQSEAQLLKAKEMLNAADIFPRRYFYPSLNRLPYAPHRDMPVTESISQRVLCLPLYPDLRHSDVMRISQIILDSFDA